MGIKRHDAPLAACTRPCPPRLSDKRCGSCKYRKTYSHSQIFIPIFQPALYDFRRRSARRDEMPSMRCITTEW